MRVKAAKELCALYHGDCSRCPLHGNPEAPKMSVVAVATLECLKVKIVLPQTPEGYAIATRLAEKLSAETGVAIVHTKEPKP